MKVCHVCQYICDDDAELCPICGAELTEDEESLEEEALEVVIDDPELAATFNDIVLAEVFCDRLKENDIIFSIEEPDLSSSMHMGFGGFYTEINVYVDKSDYDKAKEIFDDLPDISELEEADDFEEEEN